MLRSRIIPVLLMMDGVLVKTTKFGSPKYIGDPLNAVRIFNEKSVDELMFVDIGASRAKSPPDFKLIESIAAQCRMPLCYGGGVKTSKDVERIVSLGVEKVSISSGALLNPSLVTESVEKVGSSSLSVAIDVKEHGAFKKQLSAFIFNGSVRIDSDIHELLENIQRLGVGEIILNNIDRDGTMIGYDLELIDGLTRSLKVPITAVGGANSNEDLKKIITRFGLIGAGVGSLFLFKGKHRAVLLQYPTEIEKQNICS